MSCTKWFSSTNGTPLRILRINKLYNADILPTEYLKHTIGTKIDKQSTLISDAHPAYRPFVKSVAGLMHKTIKASEHVDKQDKKINLQKVNNQHKQQRLF